MNVAIYISSHGFGHATRMAALARALQDAGITVWLCANRPAFLFGALDPQLTLWRETSLDFGMAQNGWREVDKPATVIGLRELYTTADELVEAEADFLRREAVALVIADVPPLAFEAAARAGVPSVAVSNFDWPFIYRGALRGAEGLDDALSPVLAACARATLALRLPFSSDESMSAFPQVEDAGMLARASHTRRADVRRKLALDDDSVLVLALFGGFGGSEVDFEALCDVPGVEVIAVEDGPELTNYRVLTRDSDLPSLLPAVDLVVTKLGYSTLAECVLGGAPLLCTHRDDQPEDDLLLRGLEELRHPHAIVSPDELAGIDWEAVVAQVRQMRRPQGRKSANHAIARRCVELAYDGCENRRVVIDMGSNNALLLWARWQGDTIIADHRASAVSALSRGMNHNLLTIAGLRRARAILDRYIALSRGYSDDIRVYATSAAREAANIGGLADWLQRRHGVALDILSEEQEARCGALAAASSFPGRLFVFDIGGGSTECSIVEGGEVTRWVSLPVGLRRLESLFGSDRAARTDYMRRELDKLRDWDLAGLTPVGLGGTVCNLMAVKLGQQRYDGDAVHGGQLTRDDLARYQLELQGMTDADIAALMPFEPSRAGLIVAGVEWMRMLLEMTDVPAITACDRGTPFGYLMSTCD